MTEQRITFKSDGLDIAGAVRVPGNLAAGERRPAFIVLHGFGSNMNSESVLEPCKLFAELGYVSLRFDMRGCGDSGGEKGRIICLEQVTDTQSALTFLAKDPNVDPTRIALIGSSFGAAVAIYTAGIDPRVAACVSSGGGATGNAN